MLTKDQNRLNLLETLAVFSSPLDRLFQIPPDKDVALKGHLVAVDQDGSTGILDAQTLQL
jgi:hypothetical protein